MERVRHKTRQDERPQRRNKKKYSGDVLQHRVEHKQAEAWQESERALVKVTAGEDSLQLETEINSSSLSVWPQHLVGAEEDRRLKSAPAAA